MRPTHAPYGETKEERVIRKATDIRAALIECGVVMSPDADLSLSELPPERQVKWIKLAQTYVEVMG